MNLNGKETKKIESLKDIKNGGLYSKIRVVKLHDAAGDVSTVPTYIIKADNYGNKFLVKLPLVDNHSYNLGNSLCVIYDDLSAYQKEREKDRVFDITVLSSKAKENYSDVGHPFKVSNEVFYTEPIKETLACVDNANIKKLDRYHLYYLKLVCADSILLATYPLWWHSSESTPDTYVFYDELSKEDQKKIKPENLIYNYNVVFEREGKVKVSESKSKTRTRK